MAKTRNPFENDWDDAVHPHDVDVDDFIDSMEDSYRRPHKPSRQKRPGWKRIEEMKEARSLQIELSDWDYWDDDE